MAQFISTTKHGRYAVITLAKEPVNSFDTAMWAALGDAVSAVEADPAMAGLIITSGLARDVFTAGNDLSELHAPSTSAEQYARFWAALSRALVGLLTSRLATLAAIRGACPAGGCAIALACDARLMVGGRGAIGLNEVALGIPVPKFWAGLMARVVGTAHAERLLLGGTMVAPERALELGLVDELVPAPPGGAAGGAQAALLARAHALMARTAALPARARAETKDRLRRDFGDAWLAYALDWEAGPAGYAHIAHPDTVAAVGAAIARLSSKGGAAKPRPKL
ncbi:Eci1 [Scenedesmus sp. PABB004]|nr:Eci1 [Scenedesmus sp. PABB004]